MADYKNAINAAIGNMKTTTNWMSENVGETLNTIDPGGKARRNGKKNSRKAAKEALLAEFKAKREAAAAAAAAAAEAEAAAKSKEDVAGKGKPNKKGDTQDKPETEQKKEPIKPPTDEVTIKQIAKALILTPPSFLGNDKLKFQSKIYDLVKKLLTPSGQPPQVVNIFESLKDVVINPTYKDFLIQEFTKFIDNNKIKLQSTISLKERNEINLVNSIFSRTISEVLNKLPAPIKGGGIVEFESSFSEPVKVENVAKNIYTSFGEPDFKSFPTEEEIQILINKEINKEKYDKWLKQKQESSTPPSKPESGAASLQRSKKEITMTANPLLGRSAAAAASALPQPARARARALIQGRVAALPKPSNAAQAQAQPNAAQAQDAQAALPNAAQAQAQAQAALPNAAQAQAQPNAAQAQDALPQAQAAQAEGESASTGGRRRRITYNRRKSLKRSSIRRLTARKPLARRGRRSTRRAH
jgi:hypothetical protein